MLFARAFVIALLLPLASQAAVVADPEGPPVTAKAHASANAHFGDAELDRLLAPVALYPDSVLSHVLAASTYPLEVVEAARWTREHKDQHGQAAVEAVAGMDWDASVKALVAFPELLARMDSDLQWTQDLGDAFLSQQGEVMDRVQVLRKHADESGHLNSVEHERVVHEREYIYIEPEVADVVYVPYYDPLVVYGAWWWPAYPPHRWAWWYGHPAVYYSSYNGFYWGFGFTIAPSFYFCDFDWPRRQVVVVNHYDVHSGDYYGHSPRRFEGASAWQHAPEHRHGVAYRDAGMNAQWHHGYARPDEGRPGRSEGRESREARGDWTVNRAEQHRRDPAQGRNDEQGWRSQGHAANGEARHDEHRDAQGQERYWQRGSVASPPDRGAREERHPQRGEARNEGRAEAQQRQEQRQERRQEQRQQQHQEMREERQQEQRGEKAQRKAPREEHQRP